MSRLGLGTLWNEERPRERLKVAKLAQSETWVWTDRSRPRRNGDDKIQAMPLSRCWKMTGWAM